MQMVYALLPLVAVFLAVPQFWPQLAPGPPRRHYGRGVVVVGGADERERSAAPDWARPWPSRSRSRSRRRCGRCTGRGRSPIWPKRRDRRGGHGPPRSAGARPCPEMIR